MKTPTYAPVTIAIFIAATTNAVANDGLNFVLQSQYTSEYIFRGVTRSGDAVQTSAEISYANLTFGGWSSFSINDDQNIFTDEIDLYVSTSWTLSDFVHGEVGATYYHFPQLGGFFDIGDEAGDGSTIEIYGGLDFDVLFSPMATAYYDVHRNTITLEGGASYPIAIGPIIEIEPRVTAGLVEDSDEFDVDYQYAEASLRLGINIADRAALFTSGHYGISTEDTFIDTDFDLGGANNVLNPQQNAAWFKIGLSATY